MESVSVSRPKPGWVTIVVSEPVTGALGQVPARYEWLSAEVREQIEAGHDLVVRDRAAQIEGTGAWPDYTIERAREVIARG